MDLQYLPATIRDIEPIYQQCAELIFRYEDFSAIDRNQVLHWIHSKIEDKIDSYTCIYLRGEKAGYFRFALNEGMMELDDLYILASFRNQGIGTEIIRKCCQQTALPIMLYVFTQNIRATALYKRMGFRVDRSVSPTRCIMIRENL